MREIKFRVFDNRNKKISYFDLREYMSLNEDAQEEVVSAESRTYGELMQFTGLKDKNGKEIYEGDIVKTEDGLIDIICYSEKFGFSLASALSKYLFAFGELEVIGNIYENPELLEDGK